jgi:F-box associated protein
MSANENPPSLSKRQRLDKRDMEREGELSSLLSCLELIPLEILAEVLSYVNSPKDLLSVARCSKHLCATLLNPSNVIIWRRARRHCVVPDLPPPLPAWSEPAYAAFIFDEGHCYVSHGQSLQTQIIMIGVTLPGLSCRNETNVLVICR